MTIAMTIISILGTISSIYFAYMALKNNRHKEDIKSGKKEGIMITDISYIKECVDRVEKNLYKVDECYKSLLERINKVEGNIDIINKIIEGG